ncbi:MAG: hypothetical protein KGJ09_09675 [Candidatus Omnitrophica bacterium]|nr:hypothetical protein [Candidatus Omnitrophota bacterium]MDE2215377.1 hypothetical protein [Candidatus Omnitrophota bacterium]
MIQSVLDTAAAPEEVHVYVRLDSDDCGLAYAEAVGLLSKNNTYGCGLNFYIGHRPKFLSSAYNELLMISLSPIVGFMADDIQFATKGWDEIVREYFAKQTVLLLSDSGSPNDPHNVPMHGFVSRRSCQVLGYLLPGFFEHGYADHWMLDVYRQAGARVVFTDQYRIDHHHFGPEPDKMDATYQKRSFDRDDKGRTCDDRDGIVYEFRKAERKRDAEKLRGLLTCQH